MAGDNRAYGNLDNSISPANVPGYRQLQVSGFHDNWKLKNIYDLVGNGYEWTNEKYDSTRIVRGGSFRDYGENGIGTIRAIPNLGDSFDITTFRPVLYIL